MKTAIFGQRLLFIGALFFCVVSTVPSASAQRKNHWLRQTDEAFFATEQALRIGEQVLAFQRCTGGWPKNIDMAAPLTDADLQGVLAEKSRRDDSTTDNGATTMQLSFLARLYRVTGDMRFRDAFRQGVEYLLSGQYASGGWPQFWPEMRDYQIHITYNDDAMVNTMTLLRDVADGNTPYDSGDLIDKRCANASCALSTRVSIVSFEHRFSLTVSLQYGVSSTTAKRLRLHLHVLTNCRRSARRKVPPSFGC